MHEPSEPDTLRKGSADGTNAPCNCNCVKSREQGAEQPQSAMATVNQVLFMEINGEP